MVQRRGAGRVPEERGTPEERGWETGVRAVGGGQATGRGNAVPRSSPSPGALRRGRGSGLPAAATRTGGAVRTGNPPVPRDRVPPPPRSSPPRHPGPAASLGPVHRGSRSRGDAPPRPAAEPLLPFPPEETPRSASAPLGPPPRPGRSPRPVLSSRGRWAADERRGAGSREPEPRGCGRPPLRPSCGLPGMTKTLPSGGLWGRGSPQRPGWAGAELGMGAEGGCPVPGPGSASTQERPAAAERAEARRPSRQSPPVPALPPAGSRSVPTRSRAGAASRLAGLEPRSRSAAEQRPGRDLLPLRLRERVPGGEGRARGRSGHGAAAGAAGAPPRGSAGHRTARGHSAAGSPSWALPECGSSQMSCHPCRAKSVLPTSAGAAYIFVRARSRSGFSPQVREEDSIRTPLYKVSAPGGGKGEQWRIRLGQWFLPGDVRYQKFVLYFSL
ncbi:formin-2-like [Parus major]|uniref:formin-2-like n=1 Tax=Parus major TaxID=9157 RepID=UPI0007711083|nr:formin-2-like [Parus major]